LHGRGERTYTNGTVEKGVFKFGVYKYPNRRPPPPSDKYGFSPGKEKGLCKCMVLVTLKGGRLMDGELDGEGNRILPNGTTETGIFKNSLLNAKARSCMPTEQ